MTGTCPELLCKAVLAYLTLLLGLSRGLASHTLFL